jgi:hypothetical protein
MSEVPLYGEDPTADPGGGAAPEKRGTLVQGLIEIKDTHRPRTLR